MLQLTHDAATELAEARRAQGLPDTCGIRVFGEPQAGDELAIGLTFAEVPAEELALLREIEAMVRELTR